jgi:TIR domain
MARIFISHSSIDQEFAEQLYEFLGAIGHEPWLDRRNIGVGKIITTEVQNMTRDSDFLVLVLTPASANCEWVQREWMVKYWQETESRSTLIFPIMKENCDVPELLRSRLYADCTQDELRGITLLMQSLNGINRQSYNSIKPKFYEDHNSAQPDLISILRENRISEDSNAYFFQYSALEVRPVLEQAVKTGYQAVVFVQDPDEVPIDRQGKRIAVSLQDIRRMNVDDNPGNVQVYQISPPVTTKLIYVPGLFIALSCYIYLDPRKAPPPTNDQDIPQTENEFLPGQYDVSGHDNPVILIRAGGEGWQYWSNFAKKINKRYLECSQLIHPQ